MVLCGYSLKWTLCSTISDTRGWFTKSERATVVHHYPLLLLTPELHRPNYKVDNDLNWHTIHNPAGLAEWWLHKGLEAEGLGWLARLSNVIHVQIRLLVLTGEVLVVANFLGWWLIFLSGGWCRPLLTTVGTSLIMIHTFNCKFYLAVHCVATFHNTDTSLSNQHKINCLYILCMTTNLC